MSGLRDTTKGPWLARAADVRMREMSKLAAATKLRPSTAQYPDWARMAGDRLLAEVRRAA